ncbi:aminotransferase class V-fold PLP-dependent enzyme [Dyadobacter sandarakinus]|uniref:Alanine--glyoxylate aminotransferase family protein n=1 Tax=Dyadobacter sandarakinus TaxID=2747268 RepID=A0ABX7I797_9BACT|nr:aminotransferase class V-fold PLP-dependent enzyme [Dyadobacter sandarakinus]QRR01660.1 alanine--glyoxylate aminotransferase family protein [Dyadobacter sandarakinus]
MITFYPGPSKVYPQVGQYVQEAFESGLVSANHRSESFMKMLRETIDLLKFKLAVPDEYEVYLVSSATECWEIVAQSLVEHASLHIYNGAFGEKWMEYTQRLVPQSFGAGYDFNAAPAMDALDVPVSQVICFTHNETSNGTKLPDTYLAGVRQHVGNVIAVDATSSMAGVMLPWYDADLWYASVQKCFGLPAGLGVMIASPRAIAQAERVGERNHYNSFLFVRENFLKYQTPYTPNILGIYLLNRVMQLVQPIQVVDGSTRATAKIWYDFLAANHYQLHVENEAVRSDTVIAVRASAARISYLKTAAKEQGIILGNGYGADKETTFRIANFPAITGQEMAILQGFLVREAENPSHE